MRVKVISYEVFPASEPPPPSLFARLLRRHAMQSWIGLLFWALRTVPVEIAVVQSGVNQHWSADHVTQAQKAIALLSQVVETAAAGMQAGTVDPSPSPEMGAAPPPHA